MNNARCNKLLLPSLTCHVAHSIGGLVFTLETAKRLAQIPGYTVPASISNDLSGLVHIADPVIREQVLEAYATGIRYIWIVLTPLIGLGLLAALCVREYSLKTNQVKAGKVKADPESSLDIETTETGNEQEAGYDEAKDAQLADGEEKQIEGVKDIV